MLFCKKQICSYTYLNRGCFAGLRSGCAIPAGTVSLNATIQGKAIGIHDSIVSRQENGNFRRADPGSEKAGQEPPQHITVLKSAGAFSTTVCRKTAGGRFAVFAAAPSQPCQVEISGQDAPPATSSRGRRLTGEIQIEGE